MNGKFTGILGDSKKTAVTSIPLVGSRFLHVLTGFINMILIARLGSDSVAVGALIFGTMSTLLLMGWALLYSIAVIVGRVYGENRYAEIGKIIRAGFLVSILIGIPITIIAWNADHILLFLKQSTSLVALAAPYFHVIAWAIVPSLWGMCFNEFVLGIGKPRLIIIWDLFSAPLNVFLSYALLFGKFGLPKLGISGVAWSSVIAYWGVLICICGYFWFNKRYAVFELFNFKHKISFNYAFKIFKIGWPISIQLGAIAASYSFLTYMMGWLGKSTLAAHQIANQWDNFIIMIPYGVAQASGVLVSQAIGAKRGYIGRLGLAAILLVTAAVFVAGLFYWFAPYLLISVYINLHDPANSQTVSLAVILLALLGAIQISDAVGVTVTGSLRGLHDTKIPMLISVGINWLVCIPFAYYLAFTLNLGAVGLYLGFILGSFGAALLLMRRFKNKGSCLDF